MENGGCGGIYIQKIDVLKEGFDADKQALIMKVFDFACEAHKGQERMSKEPYISHCVEVGLILKSMRMDVDTICAGLLHDVLEDTQYGPDDITGIAGQDVAFLVEGVSHVTAKVFKSKGQVFSESLKKMFVAMAKDIRVVVIKLADRLHNMRTLGHLPDDRQKTIAEETLNVYAPLAHRLGISKVKSELEDIAFRVLNPQEYRAIADSIAQKKGEREARIQAVMERLKKETELHSIKAEITGRSKHFYSIYNKMARDNKKLEDIYDLLAIRVVAEARVRVSEGIPSRDKDGKKHAPGEGKDDVSDCYTILGIVHNLWKPVPGRFKDYIAMPKSNMYRSLHTTVLDEAGNPVEIQIRTKEMDVVAEEGIAAHWNYKEGRVLDEKKDRWSLWLRQLVEWQGGVNESEDFLGELKKDLFDEEVFVFTPKGDVKELVKGATVLDFAYSVHSSLGDKCTGAKVNGKWVSIKYELKNGDIIEVLKSPSQHPNADWLKAVKTPKAKNRIRHWLKENQNIGENMERGRAMLDSALLQSGVGKADVTGEAMDKAVEYLNVKSFDDILAGIGYGEFSELKIANFLRKQIMEKEKPGVKEQKITGKVHRGEIIVDGAHSDIDYKFAKCCNPVPGDEIRGIYTKKGISIHRAGCFNIEEGKISAPFVPVSWNEAGGSFYMTRLKVTGTNRDGFVNDLVNTVTHNNAFLSSVNTSVQKSVTVVTELSVRVQGKKHMDEIIGSLRRVKGVLLVERTDL